MSTTTTIASGSTLPPTPAAIHPKSSRVPANPITTINPEDSAIQLSNLATDGKTIPKARDGAAAESNPPSPTNVSRPKQRWNSPRANISRVGVCFLALFNMGLNDASYGALLPFMQTHYHLSYLVVSLVFAFPFIGYSIASIFNHRLHSSIGQRGIALLGPCARGTAYIVLSFHPPYPAVVAVLAIAGFGIGIIDAAWNAWIGDLADANQLLGLMHGAYGAGATIAPLIGTTMVVKYGCGWWQYFYVPLVMCVVEAGWGLRAFSSEDGKGFRERNERSKREAAGQRAGLRGALREKVTWICAAFLFMYVGVEGGWIVTFMSKVRDANAFDSGISATGFWLGLTLGRVTLGFITPKIGERLAVSVYLLLSLGLELLFWLVPNFIVSAVMVALLGFFLGPLFPATIVAATKLLPKHLHVSAIGFSAALGGGGAAIVPFVTGAIVAATGVDKLEPIVLALIVVLLGLWLLLPRFPKHEHES